MKHKRLMVSSMVDDAPGVRKRPDTPNISMSSASTASGRAYSDSSARRRTQLIRIAERAAPAMKDASDDRPMMTRNSLPSTILSAMAETMPDMCEVYCCTAMKPPAFTAPATKVR